MQVIKRVNFPLCSLNYHSEPEVFASVLVVWVEMALGSVCLLCFLLCMRVVHDELQPRLQGLNLCASRLPGTTRPPATRFVCLLKVMRLRHSRHCNSALQVLFLSN